MSDPSGFFAICLFLGMLGCVFGGMAIARRKNREDDKDTERGVNLVVGTLFTLLGLLLAFTLSASAGRLDTRRTTSINEANAIGTAVLRLDLLAPDDREALQRLYGSYIDERLAFNAALASEKDAATADSKLQQIQDDIWTRATAAAQGENKMLVLPPINDTFDLASTREILARTFTPAPLFWFLVVLSLLCAIFAGEATAKIAKAPGWAYRVIFCLAIAISLFIVADLDNPRVGLIKIDYVDSLLKATRDSIRFAP